MPSCGKRMPSFQIGCNSYLVVQLVVCQLNSALHLYKRNSTKERPRMKKIMWKKRFDIGGSVWHWISVQKVIQ